MGDGDMSQLMEQLGADNLAEQMGDFSKDGDGSEDDELRKKPCQADERYTKLCYI